MIASEDSIEKLRRMYEKEFGETISLKEARRMASQLLELYLVLCATSPAVQNTTHVTGNEDTLGSTSVPVDRVIEHFDSLNDLGQLAVSERVLTSS